MKNNIIYDLKIYLKENLSKNRYNHTLSVCETAIKLAKIYNEDIYKVQIAALGHDISKELDESIQKNLINKYFKGEEIENIKPAWHSYTAVIVLKQKFNINDESILNAVKYHTLGHKDMDNIAKIIYIADFIEPTRSILNLNYYQDLVFKFNYSLDKVLYIILKDNLDYLKSNDFSIPNQSLELLNLLENNNKL